MKISRIMTLVLAAAVLAVVASGTASAATYTPTFETTFYSDGTYAGTGMSVNSQPSGTITIASDGTGSVSWDNIIHNNYGYQITCYIEAFSNPSNKLRNQEWYNYIGANSALPTYTFSSGVNSFSGEYRIYATQACDNGQYCPCVTDSQMYFKS